MRKFYMKIKRPYVSGPKGPEAKAEKALDFQAEVGENGWHDGEQISAVGFVAGAGSGLEGHG